MARRTRFVSRGHVSQRRKTIWGAHVMSQHMIAGGDTAAILSNAGASILAMRPYTIVRTRGFLSLSTDNHVAEELQEFSFGHCVVSDEAFAIGVTAVPTPDTDMDSDLWYVFEQMAAKNEFSSAAGFDPRGAIQYRYDSKAMRKVEDGQTDISVIESSGASSGFELTHSFRQLIKLH